MMMGFQVAAVDVFPWQDFKMQIEPRPNFSCDCIIKLWSIAVLEALSYLPIWHVYLHEDLSQVPVHILANHWRQRVLPLCWWETRLLYILAGGSIVHFCPFQGVSCSDGIPALWCKCWGCRSGSGSFLSVFARCPPVFEYVLSAVESLAAHTPFLIILQHLEREYPGQHLCFVTVTDDEARRIEQQSFNETLGEIMVVLKKMFGPNIPDATDILYNRWWQDRLFRGTYSNWPIGVSSYEYKQLQVIKTYK